MGFYWISGCCAVGSAPALGAGRSPFNPESTVTAIPWYACDTGTSPASRGGQKNRLTTCLTTSGTKLNNQKSGISAVGSALALGARCREFESPISDHSPWNRTISGAVFKIRSQIMTFSLYLVFDGIFRLISLVLLYISHFGCQFLEQYILYSILWLSSRLPRI